MKYPEKESILYVIGLPIGNILDISTRAKEILSQVDGVLCEDTRKTGKLLGELNIKNKLVSFHAHSQAGKVDKALAILKSGQQWALVSDGGTPCISDPGTLLVNRSLEEGIRVIPIPGASALVQALSVSGFPPLPFIFLGFLSPKKGKRRRELMKWNLENLLIIIYESPYRIVKLLEDALNLFGECPVFIAREMTKEYETFYRGKLSGQLEFWQKNIPKGEFTLIFWPKGYSNDDNRNI